MLDRSVDDVDDRWVLCATEHVLLGNKSGATRLGFAVLLKLFQVEGRFPRRPEEVPAAAVEAIARQVDAAAGEWRHYGWSGRTFEYHRAQIRGALGFREATVADADALGLWLEAQVLAHDGVTRRFVQNCTLTRVSARLDRLAASAAR